MRGEKFVLNGRKMKSRNLESGLGFQVKRTFWANEIFEP